MHLVPNTRVEIMERGEWVGPFTVTDQPGRTPDHLVLSNGSWVLFEHYADEFNTRPVHTCTSQCDGCHSLQNCTPGTHRLGDLLLCGDCYHIVRAHGMDALEWAR